MVNTVVAIAVEKAITAKNSDGSLKCLDLDNLSWTKSLFVRMCYMKITFATTRPEIPEGVHKEAELIFHHQIVNMVDKYSIPVSLVVNIDQTFLKYAPVSSQKMAAKYFKHVHVVGFTCKEAITGTFNITLLANFLPIQLMYGEES